MIVMMIIIIMVVVVMTIHFLYHRSSLEVRQRMLPYDSRLANKESSVARTALQPPIINPECYTRYSFLQAELISGGGQKAYLNFFMRPEIGPGLSISVPRYQSIVY